MWLGAVAVDVLSAAELRLSPMVGIIDDASGLGVRRRLAAAGATVLGPFMARSPIERSPNQNDYAAASTNPAAAVLAAIV